MLLPPRCDCPPPPPLPHPLSYNLYGSKSGVIARISDPNYKPPSMAAYRALMDSPSAKRNSPMLNGAGGSGRDSKETRDDRSSSSRDSKAKETVISITPRDSGREKEKEKERDRERDRERERERERQREKEKEKERDRSERDRDRDRDRDRERAHSSGKERGGGSSGKDKDRGVAVSLQRLDGVLSPVSSNGSLGSRVSQPRSPKIGGRPEPVSKGSGLGRSNSPQVSSKNAPKGASFSQ